MRGRAPLLLIGVVTLLAVLICAVLASGISGWVRGRQAVPSVPGVLTRCAEGVGGLCVVSFGADMFNHMLIELHLPEEDYPPFYLMVTDSLGSRRFTCSSTRASPLTATCTGERSALGETLEIQVFARRGDALLAQGSMRLYAIALPTTINLTIMPEELSPEPLETATAFIPPEPASTLTPTSTLIPSVTFTPTVTGTITPPTPTHTPTKTPTP